MAALLPLLLSCGAVLLFSVGAQQENYNRLPEKFKKGVDLALTKFNSRPSVQEHFFFFRSLLQSDTEAETGMYYVYHHFYLKATQCPKGTVDSQSCQFREDTPLVDCGICYKTLNGEIEPAPKPHIHCMSVPALTVLKRAARIRHCNSMDDTGAPGSLAELTNM